MNFKVGHIIKNDCGCVYKITKIENLTLIVDYIKNCYTERLTKNVSLSRNLLLRNFEDHTARFETICTIKEIMNNE